MADKPSSSKTNCSRNKSSCPSDEKDDQKNTKKLDIEVHKHPFNKLKTVLEQHAPFREQYRKWRDRRSQKRISDEIDKEILKDPKRMTHYIIVCGTKASGKSTILKQMRIIYGNGYSEQEKKQYIKDIQMHIRDAIRGITVAMSSLTPPVLLENSDNKEKLDYILASTSSPDCDLPAEFFEYSESLWKDEGVQITFARRHEYQLLENAKYFLDRINIIKQKDYTPTEQDILRCYKSTLSILETCFKINTCSFHMLEVNIKNKPRKWFRCIEDVSAIIFITACNSDDTTRLKDSLVLFQALWHNPYLCSNPILLFLNKQDLLTEEISEVSFKLDENFSDFSEYKMPVNSFVGSAEFPEVHRVKCFIRDEFCKMSTDYHCCYPHFTCAVDGKNVKDVFEECREIIRWTYTCHAGLI